MASTLLKSTSQLFMECNLAWCFVFLFLHWSNGLWAIIWNHFLFLYYYLGVMPFWQGYHWSYVVLILVHHIRGHRMSIWLITVMLTFITWLRWCLPCSSTINPLFSLLQSTDTFGKIPENFANILFLAILLPTHLASIWHLAWNIYYYSVCLMVIFLFPIFFSKFINWSPL